MLLFLAKFFAIFLVLTFIINIADLSFFNQKAAQITADLNGLQSYQNAVFFEEKVFFVTNNCLGLLTASILAGLIFSFKKPVFKKKLGLFISGFLLIIVVNVFRLWLVLFLAKKGFDVEFVHTLTWFFMSAIVLMIWYFGSKKYFKKEVNELV